MLKIEPKEITSFDQVMEYDVITVKDGRIYKTNNYPKQPYFADDVDQPPKEIEGLKFYTLGKSNDDESDPWLKPFETTNDKWLENMRQYEGSFFTFVYHFDNEDQRNDRWAIIQWT